MRRVLCLFLLGGLAVVGPLAPSASAGANVDNASCVALLASNAPPGGVGDAASFWAHEFQPFGATIVSGGASLKMPCPPPPPLP